MNVPATVDLEQQLVEDILSFANDPLGYVWYAFPWGEPGTELANKQIGSASCRERVYVLV